MTDFIDKIKEIKSGVLRICPIDINGNELGNGTGFLHSGYLITNYHVWMGIECDKCKEILISYHDTQRDDNSYPNPSDKFAKNEFKLLDHSMQK